MRAASLIIAVAASATATHSSATAQTLIKEVAPPAGETGSNFGSRVAIDGDLLTVSGGEGTSNSTVLLFERNAGGPNQWGHVATLTSSQTSSNTRRFGSDLAISGDLVAVGDWFATTGAGFAAGAVYLFERNAGGPDQWGEIARLEADDSLGEARLGLSIALDGNRLVAGSTLAEATPGVFSGAAYVFEPDEFGVWGQTAKLTPSDAATASAFGTTVGVSGDSIIVGAGSANAYIYRHDIVSGEWSETTRLESAPGLTIETEAVDIEADNAVVYSVNGGTAVFERSAFDPTIWTLVDELPIGGGLDRIDLDGGEVIAPLGDPGDAALIYRDATPDWELAATLTAPNLTSAAGSGVAKDGATLVIGDPDGGADGLVFIFSMLNAADLNGDGVVDGADLGLLLGDWGSTSSGADLNGDGVVDGADLGLMLGAWTPSS